VAAPRLALRHAGGRDFARKGEKFPSRTVYPAAMESLVRPARAGGLEILSGLDGFS